MGSSIRLHVGRDFGDGKIPVNFDLGKIKQFFEDGVPIQEIPCKNDYVIIIKKSTGYPACVTLETKIKLIERGWAKTTVLQEIDDYSNILDCNDEENPYNEYECFKDAYSNCDIAIVNPEIYTIEGDPIYTTLTITADCKIRGVADMSTDRFWGTPEIITTQCDKISTGEHSWSAINCDARNLPEMQFNFQMQLYPQILECEENGDTWVRDKFECVKENEE